MRSDEAIHAIQGRPGKALAEFRKEEVEQSIPERFEKMARTYADQIAVKMKDHALTYAQLNTMANRVSYAIVAQRGTEPEPVGLLFENGIPLIVAMLGVLKAGKFFVPLDPLSPKSRITDTLADTQAALILIDRQTSSLAQQVATGKNQLIEIDAINPDTPAGNRRVPTPSHAMACIVYTSGSTGQAKGVMLNHRYLLHRTMLVAATDGACENDKYAHLSAGTANALTNTFTALLLGATLLPFDVKQEGIARLAHWLIEERISICFISSPLYRELCATLTGSERFPDLRYVRLRSDVVYKSDIDLHRKYFPPTCALATGLASSEAGPLRRYRIDHETEIDGSEVPVGYALEDKEILLLDDDGGEIRFNQVGEIVVRSKYLSVGYWNRPDLTEAKFKPDPHDPEKRLYYTGDLGLMLPDGCLIHKGRKDFRVKIRGYGVELAEVEKSLRSHRDIQEAVVVALKTESGEARLAAYFTSRAQPAPSVSELRGYLKEKLPDYMIPSAFVGLDAIPLTSNGKVDRASLPDPGQNRPALDTDYVAPQTSVEKDLAKIWAEVLSLDQVGIHDNFFDLGGHSLLATQVISRMRDAFQVELPLRGLFETPTVAGLAAQVAQKNPPPAETASVLAELESLSDEEAQRLLAQESSKAS